MTKMETKVTGGLYPKGTYVKFSPFPFKVGVPFYPPLI